MTQNTLVNVFKSGGFEDPLLNLAAEPNNSARSDGSNFYVTKIAGRVCGPWYDASFIPTKKRKEYDGKDLECMETPLRWQQSLMEQIAEPVDDRTVNWLVNFEGNIGKSKLQKYLVWKGLAQRVCMGTATQIKTAVCTDEPHACYVCNIPRVSGSQESIRDLFSALEDIKDGFVQSNMYGKRAKMLMEPPHLWVFSNDLPDLNCCSPDRWKIFRLEDKDGDMQQLTINEVKSLKKQRRAEARAEESAEAEDN